MTGSVMFRLIETVRPTLFVDEVDTVWTGGKNEPMRNVLNSGYKNSGYTWRNVGGEPQKFRTFCAKLLAGIIDGKLPDTVATRSCFINLRRVTTVNEEGQIVAPDGTTREIYYSFMAEEEADQLVKEIRAFIADWTAHFRREVPKPIAGMEPRYWEIAFPLVQIARQVGIEDEAREILRRVLVPIKDREPEEVTMLRNIKRAFDEEGKDKLWTETICGYLGEGFNGKRLSNRLKQFHISPPNNLTVGNRTKKGYIRSQFTDAWEDNL